MKLKGIRFIVEGFFANFRADSSITSQLSFLFPPKSAVLGMVCAMAGVVKDFKNYKPLREFAGFGEDNYYVGVRVLRKFNLYNDYVVFRPKKDNKSHPTKIGYLVNPAYELFFLVREGWKMSEDFDCNEILKLSLEREFFKVNLGNHNNPAHVMEKEFVEVDFKSSFYMDGFYDVPYVLTEKHVDKVDLSKISPELAVDEQYGLKFLVPLGSKVRISFSKSKESYVVLYNREVIPVW